MNAATEMMMSTSSRPAIAGLLSGLSRLLNLLQPLVALGLRWYVSWQFLQSGWLKATNWQQTVELFESEYQVPVLPPYVAAVTGTAGELLFPILLILGLGGRIGPLGLFAVNIMAVVSYAHVLLAEGFEAALAQHVMWGVMLGVLAVYGQGALSLDKLLAKRIGLQQAW